ncbi:hypothetical protein [Nocardiopsis halophila]|uniref:hypothetical protein n=1 Tax=Nocardiopsis halophila TaxID=141692 RepID=UPI00034CE52E|nr:hypothetical protein [Nocardiopsis halophila]
MALVRKGSREITVDGRAYRWRVRHRPTYYQDCMGDRLSFAVESADPRGAVLVVRTPFPHPSALVLREEPTAVTPAGVARAVRAALASGWVPDRPGAPVTVDLPPRRPIQLVDH